MTFPVPLEREKERGRGREGGREGGMLHHIRGYPLLVYSDVIEVGSTEKYGIRMNSVSVSHTILITSSIGISYDTSARDVTGL